MSTDLTRRRLFGLAGASAAGATGLSLGGCTGGTSSPPKVTPPATSTDVGPPFVSRPDLTPPHITITRHGREIDSRYIFLNAPYSGPGHGGTIIVDAHGQFVWFGPNTATHHRMNFSVQTYNGHPVLTWYQGLVTGGFGRGELIIADSSYKILHVIQPANGDLADFHEFVVTPQDTALITIYRRHSGVDLRGVGGPSRGYIISGVVQEIDIATGKLLFQWDSWDGNHPPVQVAETYQKLGVGDGGDGSEGRPYNYFHANSLAIDHDGDLLVSARNTCAVYKVSRQTGKIVWRLNGKKSDFTMGPLSRFWWQHHARPHSDGRLNDLRQRRERPCRQREAVKGADPAPRYRRDAREAGESLHTPGADDACRGDGQCPASRRRQDVRRLGHRAAFLRVLSRWQAPARR